MSDTDRRFKCGDAVTWGGKSWAHRITSFCPEGVFVDASSAMGEANGVAYFVSWDGNGTSGAPLEIADFEPDERREVEMPAIEDEATIELEITKDAGEILCCLLGGVGCTREGSPARDTVEELFVALDSILPGRTKSFEDFFSGRVTAR